MTPKPDTSPANVARVLRDVTDTFVPVRAFESSRELLNTCARLADALDQQAAVSGPPLRGALTWDERENAAYRAFNKCRANYGETYAPLTIREADCIRAAVIAAFPELAPTND